MWDVLLADTLVACFPEAEAEAEAEKGAYHKEKKQKTNTKKNYACRHYKNYTQTKEKDLLAKGVSFGLNHGRP